MNKSTDPARSPRRGAARVLVGSLALTVVPIAAGVATPAQGAPAATAFTGTWIGQDPEPPVGDGSTVHLVIRGGSNVAIELTDDFGSVCLSVGSPVTEFASRLTGHVHGSRLDATFKTARCGPVVVDFLIGTSFSWRLDDRGNDDPSDDTLFDGSVLWRRA